MRTFVRSFLATVSCSAGITAGTVRSPPRCRAVRPMLPASAVIHPIWARRRRCRPVARPIETSVLLINSHLVNWDALSAMSGTIVLLMAVERIELFAEACSKAAGLRIRQYLWFNTERRPRSARLL